MEHVSSLSMGMFAYSTLVDHSTTLVSNNLDAPEPDKTWWTKLRDNFEWTEHNAVHTPDALFTSAAESAWSNPISCCHDTVLQ